MHYTRHRNTFIKRAGPCRWGQKLTYTFLWFLFLVTQFFLFYWQSSWRLSRSKLKFLIRFFFFLVKSFLYKLFFFFSKSVAAAAGSHVTQRQHMKIDIQPCILYTYKLFLYTCVCVCVCVCGREWRHRIGRKKKNYIKGEDGGDPTLHNKFPVRIPMTQKHSDGKGRSSLSKSSFMFPLFALLHDDVRCGEEHGQRGDNGEHGEDEEAYTINHHSGKLPFSDEIIFVVFLLQLGSDEAQLANNRLQVPLSLFNQ